MDLLKQARAIGAGVPREPWKVAEFQTQIENKAAHIQELRRRGYDWSSVFSGESEKTPTFERALHEDMARRISKCYMPSHDAEILVPLEALGYGVRAALPSDSVTGGASVGGNLVETQVLPVSPVAPLLPVSCMLRAGAQTVITDKNSVLIPRLAMPTVLAGWGETSTTTATTTGPTSFLTTQVSLNAQWFSAQASVGNGILRQAAAGEEKSIGWMVGLIGTVTANLVDNLAINGSGQSQRQVLGLINWPVSSALSFDSSKLAPSITYGGAATASAIRQAHYNLDSNSYPNPENRAWIISPKAAQKWSNAQLTTGYPKYLLDWDTLKVGPNDCIITNQLTATQQSVLIDGSQVVYLITGGGFAVTIDKYTYAASDYSLITVGLLCDVSLMTGHAVLSTDSAAQ